MRKTMAKEIASYKYSHIRSHTSDVTSNNFFPSDSIINFFLLLLIRKSLLKWVSAVAKCVSKMKWKVVFNHAYWHDIRTWESVERKTLNNSNKRITNFFRTHVLFVLFKESEFFYYLTFFKIKSTCYQVNLTIYKLSKFRKSTWLSY